MNKSNISRASGILEFYRNLEPVFTLPEGVSIMHPFTDPPAWQAVTSFYRRFYKDGKPRTLIFGINPGRFGGGITGIPFTDPIRLQEICGIENDWQKKGELSSRFVYDVIAAYGGPAKFYADFFITALCPLGFTKEGKNMNYYDDKKLLAACEPFMIDTIRQQLAFLAAPDHCFCMGEGANFKYFSKLNERHGFFKKIIPLPHPRWVMQYRSKRKEEFVEMYTSRLTQPHCNP